MENFNQRLNTSSDSSNNDLLSLAFDCTDMVTKLSKGLELESRGDHQSAMSELKHVRSRIDSWLDKLSRLNTEGVDKNELVKNLEVAKKSVTLDLED
ncbi:MAG: hypothetical protein ACOC7Z_02445 [Candidatus Bipolaricaulota bacterium]